MPGKWPGTKKLTILGTKYDFKVVDTIDGEPEKFDPETQNLIGQHNYAQSTIKVVNYLSKDATWNVMWHETMHAVLSHLGYDDLATAENFVSSLASTICQILRDNPCMRGVK